MDTLIRLRDNFDAYVNGNWQHNTLIPADKPSYGIGYMIHDHSRKMLKLFLKTLLKVVLRMVPMSKKLAPETNIQPSYKPLASRRGFFLTLNQQGDSKR